MPHQNVPSQPAVGGRALFGQWSRPTLRAWSSTIPQRRRGWAINTKPSRSLAGSRQQLRLRLLAKLEDEKPSGVGVDCDHYILEVVVADRVLKVFEADTQIDARHRTGVALKSNIMTARPPLPAAVRSAQGEVPTRNRLVRDPVGAVTFILVVVAPISAETACRGCRRILRNRCAGAEGPPRCCSHSGCRNSAAAVEAPGAAARAGCRRRRPSLPTRAPAGTAGRRSR